MAFTLTSDVVLGALRSVQDPDLKRDLVALNMIRDLVVSPQGEVSFRVVLTTPACPLKAQMEKECQAAVSQLPGVTSVQIRMDSEVKPKNSSPGQTSHRIDGVSHIIAVSSGKGGVGKSTVAVNLAVALAADGARVGLMDADVYGPNVPTMMGVIHAPQIQNHPVKGEVFIPPVAHGVKVMSMGFLIQGDQPVVWRGPMLHSVVNQFCYKVDWGHLDYLVIDMPPGTGDVQLSLAQLVPVTGAVLVTTPQEVSMQDVRKAFHMFEKVRVPVIGVVENMSSFTCEQCAHPHFPWGQGGGQALARKFNLSLLAELPWISDVRRGGDEGVPIVLRDPQSKIALSFVQLARKVAQETSILTNQQTDLAEFVQIGSFH